METVLATVFQTFNQFFKQYPDCQIIFMGSTPARTRLYQIAINRELKKALEMFEIKGFTGEKFEPLTVNKSYIAFVFALK